MRKPPLAAALVAAALALVAIPSTASAQTDRVDLAITGAVNAIRAQHGLGPLTFDLRLAAAAQGHSGAMARHNILSHAGMTTRVHRAHAARVMGETLAWMPRRTRNLAARVVAAWMASPPHRAALLDRRFDRIGVGRQASRNGTFVTAELTSG